MKWIIAFVLLAGIIVVKMNFSQKVSNTTITLTEPLEQKMDLMEEDVIASEIDTLTVIY
jgi:hypothetical protein